MKGFNEHQHVIRAYKKGGSKGKQCMTICDQTKKRVGSADCERNCRSFAGIDYKKQEVLCWKL